MIVCVCRRVSDQTIRRAIETGAESVDDIQIETGAGSQCGCCVPTIVQLLAIEEPA